MIILWQASSQTLR